MLQPQNEALLKPLKPIIGKNPENISNHITLLLTHF